MANKTKLNQIDPIAISDVTGLTADLALKANIASPTFTGTVTTPALTLSTFTAGSVLFAGTGGIVTQDNTNLFWDSTNNRLGIGLTNPTARLHVVGTGSTSTTNSLAIHNSTGTNNALIVRDDGRVTTAFDAYVNSVRVGMGGGNISSNTTIGAGALTNNTTGYDNTAIGPSALTANNSGYSNTAVGKGSLITNTTGFNNTAIGSNTLTLNTDGSNNTTIGTNSLFSNTTGSLNTAIGSSALNANTTGSLNLAIGQSALGSNTEGFINIAIGQNTLLSTTTGYNNAAIGRNTLYNNTTGAGNVAIGVEACFNTTGSPYVQNDNTLIGYRAGYQMTSGTNNMYLGANTAHVTAAESNVMNIKNFLYGKGTSSSTATAPLGSLGIAVTTPTARVHLPAGTAILNTAPLKFTTGTNVTTPENGAMEYDTDLHFTANSFRHQITPQFIQTATGSGGASSTAEFAVTSTGIGSLTIAANKLQVGSRIRLDGMGTFTRGGGNLSARLAFGASTLGQTVANSPGAGATAEVFSFFWAGNVRSIGATGTIIGQGYCQFTENNIAQHMVNTAAVTIDTTIANTLSLNFTWATSNATNNVSLTNLTID